ncbi:MAG: 50S ribosomal protein L5 [Armatimonadetes bacterium]|nr:50S ribosomal protein L5 [Armatimonadota bacterium]
MAKKETQEKKQKGAAVAEGRAQAGFETQLKKRYATEIAPELAKQFNLANPMEIPKLTKVVLNMGVGEGEKDSKQLDNAVREMTIISAQKPVVTVAKKPISNFKIRENYKIGCKVTLRGDRMYVFLEKLINIVLPRIRDFNGVSPKSFDGRGNYSLGVKEQIIFPEIVYDEIDRARGMDITICTSARTDEMAYALLKQLGMPFRER